MPAELGIVFALIGCLIGTAFGYLVGRCEGRNVPMAQVVEEDEDEWDGADWWKNGPEQDGP